MKIVIMKIGAHIYWTNLNTEIILIYELFIKNILKCASSENEEIYCKCANKTTSVYIGWWKSFGLTATVYTFLIF